VRSLQKRLFILIALFFAISANPIDVKAVDTVERSYHGQLGRSPALGGWGNGFGMLEKWDPFYNFSFEKEGRIKGFKAQCGECHTSTFRDLTTGKTECRLCHETKDGKGSTTLEQCLKCHQTHSTLKRGDILNEEKDIHLEMGMTCQECHERLSDTNSDHQFAKGYAIDTTEDTVKGTVSCLSCHDEKPHADIDEGEVLDSRHVAKIACVTCHTGPRPGEAIKSRVWNKFTKDGKPATTTRQPGWIPDHKWYIGKKLGNFSVLGATELMSKIYPFNVVTFTWFIEGSDSALDDIIIVPEVKAADADKDEETTVEEMRKYENGKYKEATLITKEFNYSISHSIVPAEKALSCKDCHGEKAYVLNWEELGYDHDPLK
jgi:methanogenesis multiheme c-type cytochrome